MPLNTAFSDKELESVQQALFRQYQKSVEIQLADHDVPLQSAASSVACPAIFWHQQNANFVVCKTPGNQFQAQFFYTPHDMYDAGVDAYDDLTACVCDVLQAEQNHNR